MDIQFVTTFSRSALQLCSTNTQKHLKPLCNYNLIIYSIQFMQQSCKCLLTGVNWCKSAVKGHQIEKSCKIAKDATALRTGQRGMSQDRDPIEYGPRKTIDCSNDDIREFVLGWLLDDQQLINSIVMQSCVITWTGSSTMYGKMSRLKKKCVGKLVFGAF